MTLAKNARATTQRLFNCDPAPTTDEDIAGIYERAFK
jgi:alcohol dehydrogenase